MAEENIEDPTLSALVKLLPADKRTTDTPVSGMNLTEDLRAGGLAKQILTTAGFEVHAPMGASFSIGGRRSLFESYFGAKVTVDDSELARRVTIEGGGHELPLIAVTDQLQGLVQSVEFVPPPDFFSRS